MKHSNGDTLDEIMKNPTYVAMGGGVIILVVVLFCMIVWNGTHRTNEELIMNNSSTNTVEIPSMGESLEEEVLVTPMPEEVVDEEKESIEQLIAEKSNDQGIVFKEIDDWITAKEVTNLRSEPSTARGVDTVVVKLNNGEPVRRIGIDEASGWSKVIYEDQIVYASTAYMVEAEVPTEVIIE